MYLSHYRLQHKPFQISTDPRFLWLGEKHEEALATLRYGILDNKGFLLLTGDVGTGKTTLINTLLKTLEENTLVASIRDPALDPMDFYNYTAHAFGIEGNFTSKGSFLIQFERFLHDANNMKKRVLLIIDEAQRIDQELLEEVRLLSNIEKEYDKLLNIFFVGQIEFNTILLRPENRPIRQRITVNYNIPTLTRKETGAYIQHRLKVAGSRKKIFEEDSLNEIFSFSRGYPRLINIICDRSLLTGFVEESGTITLKHVQECVKELKIPELTQSQNTVKEITAEHERDAAVLIPKGVSTHPTTEKQQNGNNRNTARNVILAAGVLSLVALSYFSFSKNGLQLPGEQTFRELVRGFYKPNDKTAEVKAKAPDTEKKIVPPQPEPALKNEQKRTSQEEAVSGKAAQGNKAWVSTENNRRQRNTDQSANAGNIEQAGDTVPLKKPTKNNQNPSKVTENDEFIKSGNDGSVATTDSSSLEKSAPNVTEQVEIQTIQIKPLVDFEKLVIPFPTNSNLPSTDSLNKLDALADSLLTGPFHRIIVTGFTDSRGNEAFNKKLSEFRANAIKSYLVGKGLEESLILTQGSGSQDPIAPNTTFSGRMANRRVEIEILR